jgi:hypothetical protein
MTEAKAIELCPEDHIKSQNHFTLKTEAHREGQRQWLLMRYGLIAF